MGLPGHQVVVGGRDLTDRVEALTYSNTDPGGFESATITPREGATIKAGQPVTVLASCETAWLGTLNEVGDDQSGRHVQAGLHGVGPREAFQRKPVSMIFADRDLARWTGASRTERARLLTAANRLIADPATLTDPTTGLPALNLPRSAPYPAYAGLAWYDAGQGNKVASVYFDDVNSAAGGTGAGNTYSLLASDTDSLAAADSTSLSVPPTTVSQTLATARRILAIQWLFTSADATSTQDELHLRNLAVYGNHGLTLRGASPGGLYVGDIAAWAATVSGAGFDPVIADTSNYILPHAVYDKPVMPEQIIDDMAQMVAYHWGVWEPASILGAQPRFFLTAPPVTATATIARGDCTGLRPPAVQLDKVYNRALVLYHDPAGSQGTVTVARETALLPYGVTRVLQLDMGVGSAASAEAFGNFALRISQQAARGGGSATLPLTVKVPGGGERPACLLKAGRDRLRITDLTEPLSLTDESAAALDTFRIARVETTVTSDGPTTRVDFDGGTDLLAVLQARLAAAATTVGAG